MQVNAELYAGHNRVRSVLLRGLKVRVPAAVPALWRRTPKSSLITAAVRDFVAAGILRPAQPLACYRLFPVAKSETVAHLVYDLSDLPEPEPGSDDTAGLEREPGEEHGEQQSASAGARLESDAATAGAGPESGSDEAAGREREPGEAGPGLREREPGVAGTGNRAWPGPGPEPRRSQTKQEPAARPPGARRRSSPPAEVGREGDAPLPARRNGSPGESPGKPAHDRKRQGAGRDRRPRRRRDCKAICVPRRTGPTTAPPAHAGRTDRVHGAAPAPAAGGGRNCCC